MSVIRVCYTGRALLQCFRWESSVVGRPSRSIRSVLDSNRRESVCDVLIVYVMLLQVFPSSDIGGIRVKLHNLDIP